jgi:hypothetical protein
MMEVCCIHVRGNAGKFVLRLNTALIKMEFKVYVLEDDIILFRSLGQMEECLERLKNRSRHLSVCILFGTKKALLGGKNSKGKKDQIIELLAKQFPKTKVIVFIENEYEDMCAAYGRIEEEIIPVLNVAFDEWEEQKNEEVGI